uniref:Uncharacterized protein n=1 Tax=Tanacetum cinerariifolium TaxID=118510 RepID=A0A699H816_TANCI|nr:hypothetical protein [Tanacetum cinerariifolium]
MKKLPIKSLAQFRSVSNAWKSLIDSVKFIADYDNVCQPRRFGVCPLTLDPKIIMIPHYNKKDSTFRLSRVEVKVFSLSSRARRRPSINLPRENMTLETPQVVIDEFVYHLAFDYSKKGYVSNLIISFDLTSEEFREIHLPESIKLGKLSICKLRETLVVLEYNMVVASEMPLCAVWMMDNDSFTQLYTIKAPAPSFNAILGFRKTSAIIFKRRVYNDNKSVLATYEPDSKHITEIGVFDSECSFSVHSYKETQLFIDQPDGTIY